MESLIDVYPVWIVLAWLGLCDLDIAVLDFNKLLVPLLVLFALIDTLT